MSMSSPYIQDKCGVITCKKPSYYWLPNKESASVIEKHPQNSKQMSSTHDID